VVPTAAVPVAATAVHNAAYTSAGGAPTGEAEAASRAPSTASPGLTSLTSSSLGGKVPTAAAAVAAGDVFMPADSQTDCASSAVAEATCRLRKVASPVLTPVASSSSVNVVPTVALALAAEAVHNADNKLAGGASNAPAEATDRLLPTAAAKATGRMPLDA